MLTCRRHQIKANKGVEARRSSSQRSLDAERKEAAFANADSTVRQMLQLNASESFSHFSNLERIDSLRPEIFASCAR